MDQNEISSAVIKRLPRYYRFLGELCDAGIERISSKELSDMMKVTASQIRQDLNNFGGFGQQGYGYNVANLYEEIGKILGLTKKHNLILIGAGNLGQALANYVNFEKRGFTIRGIFDINDRLFGEQIRNIPIMSINLMEAFIKENNIDIAVIAIPKSAAIKVAKQLVDCNIKAIWNFSHVEFAVPDDVIVENVHLSESLMRLSYNLNRLEEGRSESEEYNG